MLTYNFCAGFFFVVTFLIQHVGNFYIDVEYLLSTSTASRKKKQNLFYKWMNVRKYPLFIQLQICNR